MHQGEELLKLMSLIRYGYIDINSNISDDFNDFAKKYILQSPKELTESKLGICWDQVEFERDYFNKKGVSVETYFIVYYNNDNCPTHTFLIYEDNKKYIWFENSWKNHRGIHVYNNKDELIKDVKAKFILTEKIDDKNYNNLYIYQYSKPNYGIDCLSFYKHCEKGNNIIVK